MADPLVYGCLERGQVLPQLYLLRWIRVLFAREFAMDEVLFLWDALMPSALALLDGLCLAGIASS